jgi:hypothetical protein
MPNELEVKEWIKVEVVSVASLSWYLNTGIAKNVKSRLLLFFWREI